MIRRENINAPAADAAEDKNSRRVAETEIFFTGPPLIETTMMSYSRLMNCGSARA